MAYINLNYYEGTFSYTGESMEIMAEYDYPIEDQTLTATPNAEWVSVTMTGASMPDIDYTVATEGWVITTTANPSNIARRAEVAFSFVNSQGASSYTTFIVNQDGTPTNTSITIDSSGSTIAASGGTLNTEVTYPDGSTLTVSSDSDWLEANLDIGMVGDGISTDKYFINVSANTTTSERIGVITFSIGDSSVTYTVTQSGVEEEPEEPEDPDAPDTGTTVTPAIGAFATAKDIGSGNTSFTIRVGYSAITNIDLPSVNVDWIDYVSQAPVTGTFIGYDTVIEYSFTADENTTTSERIGVITFAGDNLTASTTVTQDAGEAPDTGTTDTSASISLNFTSGNLPSGGGSVRVKATTTNNNGNAINVTTDDSWITLEKVSGETSDGNTIGDWRITATANKTSTSRFGIITFSYTNIYGVSASAVYTLTQAAPATPEDPDTGTTTTVTPFITTVNLDASATTFSVTVGYNDTTTISAPTDNANWISYASSGNVTSSYVDYDRVYKYNFTVTPNTSSSVKTATITFVGDNATAYTAVIQAAYVAPEEPEEPDIPSSTEVYYGPIWKDVEFTFGSVPVANYTIWRGNNLIFSGRSCLRPNSINNTILVNKICQNYLTQPKLDLNSVSVSYALTPFYLKNEAGTTTYKTYYFVNDWSYSDYFNTGLLSHPIRNEKYIYRNQWCPFTIFGLSGSTVSYGIKYDPNIKDEYGNAFQDYNGFETARNEVYTEYFKALRNYNYAVDSIYIGNTTYKMKDDCNVEYVLYYVNPWGGYDWFALKGRTVIVDDVVPYHYQRNYNNTTIDFGKSRYLSEIKRKYNTNTGWLTADESNKMWYLLESNIVYLHNLRENKIYPVLITNTMVEHKKRTIGSSRINYQITIEESQTRQRF